MKNIHCLLLICSLILLSCSKEDISPKLVNNVFSDDWYEKNANLIGNWEIVAGRMSSSDPWIPISGEPTCVITSSHLGLPWDVDYTVTSSNTIEVPVGSIPTYEEVEFMFVSQPKLPPVLIFEFNTGEQLKLVEI